MNSPSCCLAIDETALNALGCCGPGAGVRAGGCGNANDGDGLCCDCDCDCDCDFCPSFVDCFSRDDPHGRCVTLHEAVLSCFSPSCPSSSCSCAIAHACFRVLAAPASWTVIASSCFLRGTPATLAPAYCTIPLGASCAYNNTRHSSIMKREFLSASKPDSAICSLRGSGPLRLSMSCSSRLMAVLLAMSS